MFENQQDTVLLLDALMSAVRHLESEEEDSNKQFDLDDRNEAVTFVSSTMLELNRNSHTVKSERELLQRQLDINRRCHAVMFFTALKSHGITCTEASKYYEFVTHTFPTINWRFYVKLNFACGWSEYFVECCQQLEPDILAIVIKQILNITEQDELLKQYSWHLTLQAAIHRFFILEDLTLCSSREHCNFSFPFIDLGTTIDQNNGACAHEKNDSFCRSQLLHAYVTLLNKLLHAVTYSLEDYGFIKIILHGYKTMFGLLAQITVFKGSSIKELFRLNLLLEQFTTEKSAIAAITVALDTQEKCLLTHCYATSSWEISATYLLFILCTHWDEVLEKKSTSGTMTLYSRVEHEFPSEKTRIILEELCPLFKKAFDEQDGNCVHLLRMIVFYHYPCAWNAVNILLQYPMILEKDEIMFTLEENVSIILPSKSYKFLVDAVVGAKSPEGKLRLLNLFLRVLTKAPNEVYNRALSCILYNYGHNDHFMLPDFHDRLTQLIRKTMVLQEAETYVLPLFIQSTTSVLDTLVEQALVRGSEGMKLLQVLKHVPIAARYENYLVESMSRYFCQDELSPNEAKNLTSLVASVMEIQSEINILTPDKFFNSCIHEAFVSSKKDKFDIGFDCLNVTLKILVRKNKLLITVRTYMELIHHIGIILNGCIQSSNGRRKELALTTLDLLLEHLAHTSGLEVKDKECLQSAFSTFDPLVRVYAFKLIGSKKNQEVSNETSCMNACDWTRWCHTKDMEHFKEAISEKKILYQELFDILTSLLLHFTMEEWIQSSHFIEELFKHQYPEMPTSSSPWLLPKSDPHLYAVARCIMDCFLFILKKDVHDIQYLTSCFTNTLMILLNREEVHPHMLVNVFMDVCHLSSGCRAEVLPTLASFLLNIKKSLLSACKDKLLQKNYLKLFYFAIDSLPESDGKISLLQKFE